jgi:hypothetical protein
VVVAPAAAGRAREVVAVRATEAPPAQARPAAAVQPAARATEALPAQARPAAAVQRAARAMEAVPAQARAAAVEQLAVAVLGLAAAVRRLVEQRALLALEPVARAPGEQQVVERARQVAAQRVRRIPAAVVASVSVRASRARARCCLAASSRSRRAAAVHAEKHESLGSVPTPSVLTFFRLPHHPSLEPRPRLAMQLGASIAGSPPVYTWQRAVMDAMRYRPDRILVGEVRDGSALELLKAWNTGHPGGMATIHANDTAAMLDRVCQLIEEVVYPAPRLLVAQTVNVCVHIRRDKKHPAGRSITGLDRVMGVDATGRWMLEPLETPERWRAQAPGLTT